MSDVSQSDASQAGDRNPKQVNSQHQRNKYFMPYQVGEIWFCGGARRNCSKCGHKFPRSERFLIECPVCFADRKCSKRMKSAVKCRAHSRNWLKAGGVWHPRGRGGYAPALGESLSKRYERAYETLDMRTVRDEAALIQTRATMVAARLTDDVCPAAWKRMAQAVQQIEVLLPRVQAGDKAAAQVYTSLLGKLFADVRAGATETANWAEAMSLAERVAELKVRESAIERDRKAYLAASEALAVAGRLSQAFVDALTWISESVKEYQQRLSVDRMSELALKVAGGDPERAKEVEAALMEWRRAAPDSLVLDSIPKARQYVAGVALAVIGKK